MSYSQVRSCVLEKAYRSLRGCANFLSVKALNLAIIDYSIKYKTSEKDIFVVTFPKSGTTWMLNVIWEILRPEEVLHNIITQIPNLEEYMIPLEIEFDSFGKLRPRRIFKSHLPVNRIVKGRGKYIYVTRNAPDVAVSLYHHNVKYIGYKGKVEELFSGFFRKRRHPLWGDWFEHVGRWVGDRSLENLLIVRYEDLQTQFDLEVRRIANFLGVEVNDNRLEIIKHKCSLPYMKDNVSRFEMVRSGTGGEGREYMNKELQKLYIRGAKPYMHLPIMADYIQMELGALSKIAR